MFSENEIEYADYKYKNAWLHHPSIGDPSWDSFIRESDNPIYIGKKPYSWPVNGYLFKDPISKSWYSFIGLYPKGYWPAGGCLVLEKSIDGKWEEKGTAIEGDPEKFKVLGNHKGGTPDVSVFYFEGIYHMVFDWANHDNSRGGLGYAWANKPEGPYEIIPVPIHDDKFQEPILNTYIRAYAATIFKRKNDWLVLHMMSTKGNGGGAWALACMTSDNPEGPYSKPKLLIYPQSTRFHPILAEFFPAFQYHEYIYAPATSVALNRSFQSIFRVPIEQADNPDAWSMYEYGSVWHDIPKDKEIGIWGQTFSGYVDEDNTFNALYFSKTIDDVGVVNIAKRKWNDKQLNEFFLSGSYGSSIAILKKSFKEFILNINAESYSKWAICWNCQGPIGPSVKGADSTQHILSQKDRIELSFDNNGWSLIYINNKGKKIPIATNHRVQSRNNSYEIKIEQLNQKVKLFSFGNIIWEGFVPLHEGRIELKVEKNSLIKIKSFKVRGNSKEAKLLWLPTEHLAGSGALNSDWIFRKKSDFKFRFGFVSKNNNSMMKLNFRGKAFTIYSPCGPKFGKGVVILDGNEIGIIDFYSKKRKKSQPLFSWDCNEDFHALIIKPIEKAIPCDIIETI